MNTCRLDELLLAISAFCTIFAGASLSSRRCGFVFVRVEQLDVGSAMRLATIQGHLTNPMVWEHAEGTALLNHLFQRQLDWSENQVRINERRVRKPAETLFIPER
jgi:hypothetical protein